jgi:histidine triad (HIT) family protein
MERLSDFYCDEALAGRVHLTRVVETENVLAFHHTRPSYDVHIVVIPKQHIASLLETAEHEALLLELLGVVRQIAGDVVAKHGACRVVTNLGRYQDSKHLHWHVVSGSLRPAKVD